MTAALTVQPLKTSGKCYHARTDPYTNSARNSSGAQGEGARGGFLAVTDGVVLKDPVAGVVGPVVPVVLLGELPANRQLLVCR
jgi:hypothetical protein